MMTDLITSDPYDLRLFRMSQSIFLRVIRPWKLCNTQCMRQLFLIEFNDQTYRTFFLANAMEFENPISRTRFIKL